MGYFTPMGCAIDDATPIWLLLGIAGLVAVVVASLAEIAVQWRRAVRGGVSFSAWLPLAPTLLWSLICGLLAGVAIGWYRDVTTRRSPNAFPHPRGLLGACFAIAQTGIEIQFALGIGIVLLLMGASALLLTRRPARTA